MHVTSFHANKVQVHFLFIAYALSLVDLYRDTGKALLELPKETKCSS
jgi:hypothetical protein